MWRLSKSVLKKLIKKAKKKCNEELNTWIQSVFNHLWWNVGTCNGDPEILKEKWVSMASRGKQAQLESFQTFQQMCASQAFQKRKKASIMAKIWLSCSCWRGGSCYRQKAPQRCWETREVSSYCITGSFSFNDTEVSSKGKAFQLQGYGGKNITSSLGPQP